MLWWEQDPPAETVVTPLFRSHADEDLHAFGVFEMIL